MGDEVKFSQDLRLVARFPVSCQIRLLKRGTSGCRESRESLEHVVKEPGVYRVEGWLTLDGEERGWLYANPDLCAVACVAGLDFSIFSAGSSRWQAFCLYSLLWSLDSAPRS